MLTCCPSSGSQNRLEPHSPQKPRRALGEAQLERADAVEAGSVPAVGELVDRRVPGHHVGGRVDQQLGVRPPSPAAALRHDGGEVAASAVAPAGSAKIPTTLCLMVPSLPTRKDVGRVETSKLLRPGCHAMATG